MILEFLGRKQRISAFTSLFLLLQSRFFLLKGSIQYTYLRLEKMLLEERSIL